ncbi:flippase-like domain-containing protein [bacterium]|nr:flippase-like domain-containing protein [bacterium]RQV99338.1 MAG: UPF0104 family protein [bacterium]
MSPAFSKRSINHGLRIFIILTLAGFILIFYLTGTHETIQALNAFRFSYFIIAGFLIGVDFLSGTSRIYIFIRKITPLSEKQAFWASFKANLSNVFLAAATPFQTGGGLAQIYMLNREGVTVSGATSVSIMNFVATLVFLMTAGLMVIRWMTRTFTDFKFHFMLSFSSTVFYFVTFVFILFLFKPRMIGQCVEWCILRFSRIWKKKARTFENLSHKIHDFVQSYQSHIIYFWKNEKWILFHNLWLTLLLYFNKCIMAYVVLKGMGLNPDFLEVVSIQILLIFLIYFCPTPGAGFLAETSTAALMSLIIPSHLLPVFSILWRFFTTYFGVIVGGVILMRTIGSASNKNE